jgi:mono/diheme cytochrome c family protein
MLKDSIFLLAIALVALVACTGGSSDGEADGSQLFAANCATCHGDQAQGTNQGPPLVHQLYEPSHHSDDAFRSAVANGVTPHHWEFGPMPAVPGLDAAAVDAIIGYVRGLQREAGID